MHEIGDIASLPLLLLMLSLLMFLVTPLLNSYCRSREHEADAFGLALTGDGETAATAFVKLANENLANPSPSPFIESWLFDHPSLSDRVAFCRAYKQHPWGGHALASKVGSRERTHPTCTPGHSLHHRRYFSRIRNTPVCFELA